MCIRDRIRGMIGYGATIAFGIMWAWLLSLTLLPSLISLLSWDQSSKSISKPSLIEKMMTYFGKLVMNHPKRILSIGLSII